MGNRALKYLVLAWALAWFVWVLPGHQRGSVKVPGGDGRVSACAQQTAETVACPLCAATEQSSGEDESAPVIPGTCCAICALMATLTTPPVFVFDPPDSYLLDLLAAPESEGIRAGRLLESARSRGPPRVA